ncbi:hypothetical protein HDU81_010597 [Chytriomyces hyalinus]|nr:hypothetical protein HDU81_010597 [Chytriomyces hyalinus]
MRAVLISAPGDASKLVLGETQTPVPKATELLVKVHSFALNRMDISQRMGSYPPPPGASSILGVEFSGTIVECGSDAKNAWKEGDEVFGLVPGGAYAEYVVIDAEMAIRKPQNISWQVAAALPEVWFTAYQALFLNCNMAEGEDVLIHAGASGVGLAAIQLAKLKKANRIIVTVGSDEKKDFCKSVGATHAINYKTEEFATKVLEFTGKKGVDVIVDFVGQTHWSGNLESLAMDGRMVMLAFLSGPVIKESNLAAILRKRLTIRGSTLRSRDLPYQRKLKTLVENEVFSEIFNGNPHLQCVIDKEFSWKDIIQAHTFLESNVSKGKIVVNID